ncbi:MAG: hypothetical protein ABL962_07115 [Fimbriimonadaceae bacterium]
MRTSYKFGGIKMTVEEFWVGVLIDGQGGFNPTLGVMLYEKDSRAAAHMLLSSTVTSWSSNAHVPAARPPSRTWALLGLGMAAFTESCMEDELDPARLRRKAVFFCDEVLSMKERTAPYYHAELLKQLCNLDSAKRTSGLRRLMRKYGKTGRRSGYMAGVTLLSSARRENQRDRADWEFFKLHYRGYSRSRGFARVELAMSGNV